jgi:hypothetical protein
MTVTDPAEQIERLAARIQALPAAIRWVHAQQDIIQALGCGIATERGPQSRKVDRLISAAERFRLGCIFAAAMSLALLLEIFFRQILVGRDSTDGRLFVGIGAMREPRLIELFGEICPGPMLYLNETDATTFFRYQAIDLGALLGEWWSVWNEVRKHLSASHAKGLGRHSCLAYLVLRGHMYAYYRCWFRCYLRHASGSDLIGFSAASYVAHAAISVGARGLYLVHGFQRRSLVYPTFERVYCFNSPEADHIKARLPEAEVEIDVSVPELLKTRRVAVIAGDYANAAQMDRCRSFIKWALARRLPVVVRPHPQDRSGYWEQWRGVEGIQISDEPCSFVDFLLTHRPRVMVTSFSTTLLDAALLGVLPVTLETDECTAADLVFPLCSIAIRWPEEVSLVEASIDDEQCLTRIVTERRQMVIRTRNDTHLARLPAGG